MSSNVEVDSDDPETERKAGELRSARKEQIEIGEKKGPLLVSLDEVPL